MRVAAFISPHGFGHAARTVAVLQALGARRRDLEVELFTTVPRWFFEGSLSIPFGWNALESDVGLVQRSAVEEDLAATVERVGRFVATLDPCAASLAPALRDLACDAVLADISPLGLATAEAAGLPAALVENFTWDWIYAAYVDQEPRLRPLAADLAERFQRAALRIRTTPFSPLRVVARPETVVVDVPPVARRLTRSADLVRAALGVASDRPLVVFTMGGVSWRYTCLDRLAAHPEVEFALLAGVETVERNGNVALLPDRSPVPVPDLIAAADVVVGKLGYSTVAEAWCAGTRYAFVRRPLFPESPVLEGFVRRSLPCLELSAEELASAGWLDRLDGLLAQPRGARQASGAVPAAEAFERLLA